jgi:hypothetical protein
MFDLATKTILQIEPTTSCALSCPQCARYVEDEINPLMKYSELSLTDIQKLCPTDWVEKLHKMFMCGNFGEPAAARDCLKIYQWFRQINADITLGMNTSGSLRTVEWWEQLAKILAGPLDYVVFSIDGLEDTNHVYRRNSNWHKIIENATAFINAGGKAHWDMLVFDHNKHQVESAQQLARNLGFTWFRTKYTDRPVSQKIQWLKKVSNDQANVHNGSIECHYESTGQAYLSATGEWLPCCYIGGKLDYPDDIGAELRQIFNNRDQPQIFDQAHQNTAWQTVWQGWDNNPLKICLKNCATPNGQPKALDKWKQEIKLK